MSRVIKPELQVGFAIGKEMILPNAFCTYVQVNCEFTKAAMFLCCLFRCPAG